MIAKESVHNEREWSWLEPNPASEQDKGNHEQCVRGGSRLKTAWGSDWCTGIIPLCTRACTRYPLQLLLLWSCSPRAEVQLPRSVCALKGNGSGLNLTLRASAPGSQGLLPTPNRVVTIIEHRRSLGSHLALALSPPSPISPSTTMKADSIPWGKM